MKWLYKAIGVYSLIYFGVTMFISIWFYIPCFFLKGYKQSNYFRIISKYWIGSFLFVIGCKLIFRGLENFAKNKNYILIANHTSIFDPVITTQFFPHPTKSIAKKTFAKVPIFGYIYSWGSILVDRNDKNNRMKSYLEMKEVLANGIDMVIYPEGTRNKRREEITLLPFRNGAFKLAKDTQKEIIPIVILNAHKVINPKDGISIKPGKIYIDILKPISPKDFTEEELKNYCYNLMKNHLENYQA